MQTINGILIASCVVVPPPFTYALSDIPFAISIFRTPNMGVAASY